jgi:hypothetical protein
LQGSKKVYVIDHYERACIIIKGGEIRGYSTSRSGANFFFYFALFVGYVFPPLRMSVVYGKRDKRPHSGTGADAPSS